MILEQLQLLFMLYRRPVKAASRIIDTGRFWFALCAALLVLFGLQAGMYLVARPAAGPAVPVQQNTANTAQTEAGQEDASPPAAPPLAAKGAFGPALYLSALLQVMEPASALKVIGALALAFVPAVILVMTLYRSRESFPVMLRKDYLSFANCVLYSLAAAYLPVAIVNAVVPLAPYHFPLILALLAATYFLVLVAFSVRTLWGSGMLAAAGASLAGSAATVVGLGAFMLLGSGMYYLSSPFFLYYAYILLGSDARALGDGFRARQHMRRQLDIATSNPRDADAHYQLGLIYQQRRQYDEAKQRFARSIEIDPREADPVFQLGRIALVEERWDDAIEWLSKAAALDDKCCSREVWRELGVAYFETSRLEEARRALGKYVEHRPYDPEGLYWHGKTLVSLGASGEARQQFESCKESVATMPTNRRQQLSKWKRMASAELRGLEKRSAVRS